MKGDGDALTPLYSRLLLGLVKPFPNFDVGFMRPLRAQATQSLHLRAGDRVLDVGCGIGGAFPFLAKAVGPTGEVLGVEISAPTVASARRRIETNRWTHVHAVRASAQSVRLQGSYDALLMFAAPDVYGSAPALENILPHLRVGARIALFGAKTASRFPGRFMNPLFRLAVDRLSFESTPAPDARPWRLVGTVTDDLEVQEMFFGSMFMAAGSLARNPDVGRKAATTVASPIGRRDPCRPKDAGHDRPDP